MVRMTMADRDLTKPTFRGDPYTRARCAGCLKRFLGCYREIAARRIGKLQFPVNLWEPPDLVDTPHPSRPFLVVDLMYPFSSKPAKYLIVPHRKDLKISKTQPVNASLTDVSELFPQRSGEQQIDRIFSKVVDRSKEFMIQISEFNLGIFGLMQSDVTDCQKDTEVAPLITFHDIFDECAVRHKHVHRFSCDREGFVSELRTRPSSIGYD